MKKIIKPLVLFLSMIFFFASTVVQAEDSAVRIQLQSGLAVGEVGLQLWTVSETDRDLAELYQLSDAELTKRYGDPVLSPTNDKQAQIVLTNLVKGRYYVRQVTGEGELRLVPFFLDWPEHLGQTLYAKIQEEPPTKTGDYPFRKVSSQGGGLAGAIFQVFQLTEQGKESPLLVEGQPYQLTSDAKGYFTVTNLPFGSYLLREVQAPKGYQLLKEGISFEVTDYSQKNSPKKIVNTPNKPPRISVPYTGNAIVITIISLGFVIFLIGYYLTKKSSDPKEE